MGEAHDYEEMMAAMTRAADEKEMQEKQMLVEMDLAAERGFASMPANGWQVGCQFAIADVVYDLEQKKEGKIIGLPTKEDAEAMDTFRLGKAWVLFADNTRASVSLRLQLYR